MLGRHLHGDQKFGDHHFAHQRAQLQPDGRPALALAYPKHQVHFTQVPDTLRSLDRVVVKGFVGDAAGNVLSDFNGVVVPTVFDKKATVTTLDNDASEGPFTYQVFQNILHKGLASVVNGLFEFEFIVPRDIDFSYGTGRISCYALGGGEDAHGSVEDLVVGGVSADPVQDDVGPEIQLYINDSLFRAGDVVHEDPWLFARIFDESGINTSGLGIGHDAKAVLDGETASPFVLNEYFTSDLDTYTQGPSAFLRQPGGASRFGIEGVGRGQQQPRRPRTLWCQVL